MNPLLINLHGLVECYRKQFNLYNPYRFSLLESSTEPSLMSCYNLFLNYALQPEQTFLIRPRIDSLYQNNLRSWLGCATVRAITEVVVVVRST